MRGLARCWMVAVALEGSVSLWASGLCPPCGELFGEGVWGFVELGGMCGSGIGCGAVGSKAGDAVCPGGCGFVQVNLKRWWPNRVPLAWVVVRGVEVDALLGGPAVVGQDGVCDGGVIVVPERVIGLRTFFEQGSYSRSQHPNFSVWHYAVPLCTGRGIRWPRVFLQDLCFVLGPVL